MLLGSDGGKFKGKAGFKGLFGLNAKVGSGGGKSTGNAWFEGLKMLFGHPMEQIDRLVSKNGLMAGFNGGKFTGDAWFKGLKMMLGFVVANSRARLVSKDCLGTTLDWVRQG
jgi:hypothetical protein